MDSGDFWANYVGHWVLSVPAEYVTFICTSNVYIIFSLGCCQVAAVMHHQWGIFLQVAPAIPNVAVLLGLSRSASCQFLAQISSMMLQIGVPCNRSKKKKQVSSETKS